MSKPRPYTVEEMRDDFLDAVRGAIEYWATHPNLNERERIEGAVFSVLVILDGEDGFLPAFRVIPDPHPDDEGYNRVRGDNWWTAQDIAGPLHELFSLTRRGNRSG